MQLIPIENVNAIELFKSEKTLAELLSEIKKTATDFKPDTSTPDGRKVIASQAYKVSQSKTVIDSAGKDLTAEWLRKKKEVDAGRKTARDFCDNLRDEIRKPLTDWEESEKKLAAAAALKAEMQADEIDAYERNDLFDREAKMAAWEVEQEALESAKVAKEAAEKAAAERAATAKRLRDEAEAKAKQDAADAIQREKDRADQAEKDRVEANAKAVRERAEEKERARLAEIEAARQAERDKLQAIKDTEDRLERERIETERLAGIEREKAERKANQKRHVSKINKAVVAAFVDNGISHGDAGRIVDLIACESIQHVRIDYLEASNDKR